MAVDLSRIAARLREHNAREDARIRSRHADALAEVERLRREFLRVDPALRKLVLFGSLAEDRVTHLDFDIDLAVDSDRLSATGVCCMRKDRASVLRLAAELEADTTILDQLFDANRMMTRKIELSQEPGNRIAALPAGVQAAGCSAAVNGRR